jgi:hypothetical protein
MNAIIHNLCASALLALLSLLMSIGITSADDVKRLQKQVMSEYGDVVIHSLQIDKKTEPMCMVAHVEYGGKAQKDTVITLGGGPQEMKASVMLIEATQAGNDNGVASIRPTLIGEKSHAFRKIVFPNGYAVVRSQIVNPADFHFRWVLKQVYDSSNPSPEILCELKLMPRKNVK